MNPARFPAEDVEDKHVVQCARRSFETQYPDEWACICRGNVKVGADYDCTGCKKAVKKVD